MNDKEICKKCIYYDDFCCRNNKTICVNNSEYMDAETYINAIVKQDVQPVKHGRWIEKKLSRIKWIPDESDGITAEETTIEDMTEQKCSICQRWAIKFTHHIEMNYCPNCGARMDGENT